MKVKGIEFRFDPVIAKVYLAELIAGKAMTPPPEGWSADNLLLLAGCCMAVADAESTVAIHPAAAGQHAERWEAMMVDQIEGRNAVLMLYRSLAFALTAGRYDSLMPDGVYEGVAYRNGREWAYEPPIVPKDGKEWKMK